jgi:aquaporin Z
MINLPEYLIEAWGLGTFMVSAGVFATLIYTDVANIPILIPNAFLRDIIMGIITGITAISIIYSPWGKRSGAHLNPAVTITFFRLGKLTRIDTFFYCLFQFLGGILGVYLVALVFGSPFVSLPPEGLNYIVTQPGKAGPIGAIITEIVIAYIMMTMVLIVSNNRKFGYLTGLFAGILVTFYVIFAAPYSGFSMNPARSFASAFLANWWNFYWIYYFVPPLSMLVAAEVYLWFTRDSSKNICGKLCPNNQTPCLCQNPCDVCCPFKE